MGRARERTIAGEGLEEHESKGIDIGLRGDLAPVELLRRHVGGGPDGGRGGGQGRGIRGLGDAEVAQASLTVFIEHHVRGLHVTMDNPLGMDVGERGRDLPAHVSDLIERERTPADPSCERRPLDQLEDDVEVVALLAGVEHRHEVRVGEPRQHLRFPLKATSVQRRSAAMNLDRDSPMQHLVVCGEHRAHAATRGALRGGSAPRGRTRRRPLSFPLVRGGTRNDWR